MPQTISSQTVPPIDMNALLRNHPGLRVLDVRTPGEFQSAHIPGAYNVPLQTLGEHSAEIRGISDVPVVLVCQSGMRARTADDTLRAVGMSNLRILDGGINGWMAAGLPVVRGEKRISLERQVRIAAGTLAATGGFLALALNPIFATIPALVGSGLVFAGVTDTCAMGMLLARFKYNRSAACDPAEVVRALKAGIEAPSAQTPAQPAAAASCCPS